MTLDPARTRQLKIAALIIIAIIFAPITVALLILKVNAQGSR
jgi:hypothetical protein